LREIDTAVAARCPPKAPKNAASLGGLRRHRERHEEVGLDAVRLEIGLLESSLATLAQGIGIPGANNQIAQNAANRDHELDDLAGPKKSEFRRQIA
jgi:hypothetical protein